MRLREGRQGGAQLPVDDGEVFWRRVPPSISMFMGGWEECIHLPRDNRNLGSKARLSLLVVGSWIRRWGA